jgi:hypothetical protein
METAKRKMQAAAKAGYRRALSGERPDTEGSICRGNRFAYTRGYAIGRIEYLNNRRTELPAEWWQWTEAADDAKRAAV